MRKKIVIEDGRRDNLYRVEKIVGKFVVFKVAGLFDSGTRRIGSAPSLADAITLIKGITGTNRIRIENW